MKSVWKDLLITLFGALTSLLTAFALCWVKWNLNLSLYSLMVWFIIPAGAIASGFAASSGYYFGSRLFNYKPSKIIIIHIVLVSLATYIIIQYIQYSFMEFEGKSIEAYLSFWEYWNISVQNTFVQIRAGRGGHAKISSSIELGDLGYVYAVLQVIGFSLGGVVLYLYLSTRLYCKKCFLYFSKNGSSSRYTGSDELFMSFIKKSAYLIKKRNLSGVISIHTSEAGEVKCDLKKHHLRVDLNIKFCKGCGEHYLGLDVFKWNGKDDWSEIHDLSMSCINFEKLSFTRNVYQ